MNSIKLKSLAAAIAIFALLVSTACSSGQSAAPPAATNQDSRNETSGSGGEGGKEETKESEWIGPMGKYDPPVTITMARNQEINTTFPEGDSMEDNIYTRGYLEELGIKIENVWITDDAQYYEKLNIAIASGELPDIFKVNATMLAELAEAGLIMDLTEVYKNNITPLADEIFHGDGGVGMQFSTINGKLMALPYITAGADKVTMLWIRQDWLDRLGLQPPQTIDDVIAVAKAFKEDDPDGNGKDDTLGIGVVQDIFAGDGGLKGFFSGFHVYPNMWTEDENGQLVNGLTQPGMKEALAKLQEMYKLGVMDQEFTTKSGIGPDVVDGKLGMFYGTMARPLNPLQPSMDKDPNARWEYYPLVSNDGNPAKPAIDFIPPHYYVVNKNAEHPEALVNLMNFFVEKTFGETADFRYQYDQDHPSHKYPFVRNFGARKNVDNYLVIKKVYETGDESLLNPEQKGYYDQMRQYEAGDQSMWKYAKIFGPEGSLSLVNQYLEQDLVVVDKYQGLPTETMVERSGPMRDLALETFTKIILGDPIDNFDKFVEDWNKLGGDQITKEVNEWYASLK